MGDEDGAPARARWDEAKFSHGVDVRGVRDVGAHGHRGVGVAFG